MPKSADQNLREGSQVRPIPESPAFLGNEALTVDISQQLLLLFTEQTW